MALKKQKNTSLMYECLLVWQNPNQETTNQNARMQLPQEFLSIIFKIKNNNNNNNNDKWRWLAVDLYRATKRRGKYPP